EENRLTRLRADLARIEHELLALDALKLPKLLQIQNLLWPPLLLGGAVAAALGALTPVGWIVACVVGAIVAVALGVGAYLGLGSMARPQVIRHAVPIRKALADAEQQVEQHKDWVKQEFEAKLKEFEELRTSKVRDAEEKMARTVAEAEQRRQQQRQAADEKFPARAEQIRKKRDEDLKKADEKYPPRIEGIKQKYARDKQEL